MLLITKPYCFSYMSVHNPCFITVNTLSEAKTEIKQIGSDPQSIGIMAPKMITKIIKLHEVLLQDAIIVKQDMLSIGGEVAVPKHTFDLHENTATILIIGTIAQHRQLVKKLRRHYPRIQTLASEISSVLEED
ncbi:MAG: hypothetical protein R6U21_00815 [Thermoplasmatota archaeon]